MKDPYIPPPIHDADGSETFYHEVIGNYRRHLCENILRWWLEHALDSECGGIFSCIRDDGGIISTDKYVWSQVRAVWTFAAAYNRIDPLREWYDAAEAVYAFIAGPGRNDEGDWNFLLAHDGTLKEGPESIQTDAYAICALVEYARMTGSQEAAEIALETYRRVLWKLARPGSYRTKPYPIPDRAKAQRVSMQFSLAFTELGKFLKDTQIIAEGKRLTDDVLNHFRRPDLGASVEYLSEDNSLLPPPVGTYASPGHGIETAWFQIENLRAFEDRVALLKACEIMKWNFEKGWDPEYGGLVLGMDLNGGKPYLPNAEAKIWWPFTEAICGALMAYEVCREQWCLEWFAQSHNWAFSHFPDREHGEWTQRLDRCGQKIDTVVALPVKDPFHLPRGLIYAIETAARLASKNTYQA
jgi:N-acylglucosamine 2-epimerase